MRWLLAFILIALLIACDEPSPKIITGEAMGTRYHITLGDRSAATKIDAIEADVAALIEQIESQASQWRGDSWITQLNTSRSTQPILVPEHIWPMLVVAMQVYAQSEGALDITAGPLVELWGFGAAPHKQPPTSDELARTLARCGADKLVLDENAKTLAKQVPDLAIDLSALAKGYAVDCVAELLDQRGVANYAIEFGGEIKAKGNGPGGDGWIVRIDRPGTQASQSGQRLNLHDQAAASSGGSEQHRRLVDGTVVTHLIDPRTGLPMHDAKGVVTVVSKRCVDADAWATALSVTPVAQRDAIAKRAGVHWQSNQP